MYDERLVSPMRQEAVALGCKELRTAEEVKTALKDSKGTTLVFVNSVCGCAAGGARPGLALALKQAKKPDRAFTVFAGQDGDATRAAREFFAPYQASSPQIGILKDGKIVHVVQRHDIEGRVPQQIAASLAELFEKHCG